VLLLSRKS